MGNIAHLSNKDVLSSIIWLGIDVSNNAHYGMSTSCVAGTLNGRLAIISTQPLTAVTSYGDMIRAAELCNAQSSTDEKNLGSQN